MKKGGFVENTCVRPLRIEQNMPGKRDGRGRAMMLMSFMHSILRSNETDEYLTVQIMIYVTCSSIWQTSSTRVTVFVTLRNTRSVLQH